MLFVETGEQGDEVPICGMEVPICGMTEEVSENSTIVNIQRVEFLPQLKEAPVGEASGKKENDCK